MDRLHRELWALQIGSSCKDSGIIRHPEHRWAHPAHVHVALENHRLPSHPAVPQGLVHMARTEGVRGMMKGNWTNCVRIIPNSAVKFLTYEQLSRSASRMERGGRGHNRRLGTQLLVPGVRKSHAQPRRSCSLTSHDPEPPAAALAAPFLTTCTRHAGRCRTTTARPPAAASSRPARGS